MKTNLQSIVWVAICCGMIVGGVPLLMVLIAGVISLFFLIRQYGTFADCLIILFLIVSAISLFRGNPPIGILIVMLSVILGLHYSKIVLEKCIPENLLYVCMLVAILPLVGSSWRYSGMFENPNMFASFICTHMALVFILKFPASLKMLLVFGICCVCVFLSGSRSWSLVAAFFTVIVLLRVYQLYGKTLWAKSVLSLLTVVILVTVPWGQLTESFLRIFIERIAVLSEGGDGSTMERLKNLYIAVDAIIQKPFYGDGISGFYVLSGERYHSHSTLLELLVSFGLIIGGILVFAMSAIVLGLIFKPRYYGLRWLESQGVAAYLLLFLFFDSILSNVLAISVMFSLIALSPRWRGAIVRPIFTRVEN